MTRSSMRFLLQLPLILFVAIAALMMNRLGGGDPSRVPSALVGHKVPSFELPAVEGLTDKGAPIAGLSDADLGDGVFLVNVFASWCAPCRAEMPMMKEVAADGRFKVVGINYKDTDDQARRFLGTFGNPYAAVGADHKGRVGIDWGVYGVPETYVVSGGTVVFKVANVFALE